MRDEKTIFALASATGRAGVAVFRVSGREAQRAVSDLCVPSTLPAPRLAALREMRNPKTGETIDYAIVLFFSSPNSFTGEDVVEFQTHGGRAVTHAMIEALGGLPGFRMAEAGEFTRRAFENGKMDLTEAEAVADLVHAETEAQRKQALRQMEGVLGRLYEDWRGRLTQGLAMMEASIDFPEDELPEKLMETQTAAMSALRNEIKGHLDDNHRGERLREGFSVVLLGPPNAGKSSILNALAQRDAAIVSPLAGTTRDVIDVYLDIKGYPVILTDTAGLQELSVTEKGDKWQDVEDEGMRRARSRANGADLKLVVFDGAVWPEPDLSTQKLIDKETLVIVNKRDLIREVCLSDCEDRGDGKTPLFVSALTGEGMDALVERVGQEIERRFSASDAPSLTRARHREALEACVEHLGRAIQAQQADLRAEDVRLAMRSLGRITGRVNVEDLLDIVFRDFCIGK